MWTQSTINIISNNYFSVTFQGPMVDLGQSGLQDQALRFRHRHSGFKVQAVRFRVWATQVWPMQFTHLGINTQFRQAWLVGFRQSGSSFVGG